MQLGLYAGRSLSAGLALGAISGLAWKEACLALAVIQGLTILVVAVPRVAGSQLRRDTRVGYTRTSAEAIVSRR